MECAPPWLKFRSASRANESNVDSGCGEDETVCAVGDSGCLAADKPELFPWRSRLKGYRLGARLARGRHSADEECMVEPAATPSTQSSGLELPYHVGARPEPVRPDVVVD